jgi:hypothetical protein
MVERPISDPGATMAERDRYDEEARELAVAVLPDGSSAGVERLIAVALRRVAAEARREERERCCVAASAFDVERPTREEVVGVAHAIDRIRALDDEGRS